jgi:predicted  nucleic acid-binding Zn-ribbon protein
MLNRNENAKKAIVPITPDKASVRDDGDLVERAGQALVALIKEAADVTKANCEEAVDAAQDISDQLRASEGRIKDLEADLRHYQDRAARAEKWLDRVHKEVEQKFFRPDSVTRSQ